MPNLGKGTECIKILFSQASKDMHEPLFPMLFPILGAHMSGSEFQYPYLIRKDLCCKIAHQVCDLGCNKGGGIALSRGNFCALTRKIMRSHGGANFIFRKGA